MNDTSLPKLKIQPGGNAKLRDEIWTFSIPAGRSCPGARICKTWADPETRKLVDGKNQQHRCWAAVQEVAFPAVFNLREHNFSLLLDVIKARQTEGPEAVKQGLRELIMRSLPAGAFILRVHESGDFFSQLYWDAWMEVIQTCAHSTFYAYTQSLHFLHDWLVTRDRRLPLNFAVTMSMGGMFEHLVPAIREKKFIPTATVVYHPEDAEALDLMIDHTDDFALQATEDFALLLHGQQKAGSAPSQAMKRMRTEGVSHGYKAKRR